MHEELPRLRGNEKWKNREDVLMLDNSDEKRKQLMRVLSLELPMESHWFCRHFCGCFFPLVLVLFSVGFVQLVSIHAIGSGIPEMKTVLRGVNLPNYLSFRAFIQKTVALITAVGSTLPIGKEGPFVHISSIIADLMSRLISKYVRIFNHVFANEAHTNELLAAACAVGVSSNFAAPIGGVLFSIEVTSTYFAVRNYWRGFFGARLGAFLFRLIAVWFRREETITALFKTSFNIDFPFDPLEIMAFAFIGVVAGLGSALFVYCHHQLVILRRKYRKYTRGLEYRVSYLIGSVSRLNLWYMLNEQLQGVYEHVKEIKQRQIRVSETELALATACIGKDKDGKSQSYGCQYRGNCMVVMSLKTRSRNFAWIGGTIS
ncbi:LOW QUALITY PROTEIN: chloride channel protein 2-like, partial [Gigantopelta aegis]|uniref:LOW QUALITY PROTEIN: chloride channel protein 2-like n=1 Tax=Gigantopelta aegis TaxID=1735272 RepID=UPI001B88D6A9